MGRDGSVTEGAALAFNIFYIILDMRNKVVVIVVVALCLWLTLEGPATRKPQRRRAEDDSDLEPRKAPQKQNESPPKKNVTPPKSAKK